MKDVLSTKESQERWSRKNCSRAPTQAKLLRAQARFLMAEQELLTVAQEAHVLGGKTPRPIPLRQGGDGEEGGS